MWAGVAAALLIASVVLGLAAPWGAPVALAVWLAATLRRGVSIESDPPAASRVRFDRMAPVALAVIVIGCAVFRWPIASHDVEHYIGPDEGEVVENVLEMMRMGDWNHRHRGYPGLHFYLQRIPARMVLVRSGLEIPDLPRSDFYLEARRLTLLAGALGAAATYALARLWLASPAALLAACLVAASPLAFRESAVVNPDLLLMLAVTAAAAVSLRLLRERGVSGYLLAGCFVGLATAVKYTGAFTAAAYAAAWLAGEDPWRDRRRAMAGGIAAVVTFAAVSPYTFLNLGAFVDGLSMHVGYYSAARSNAPLLLSEALAFRGLGLVAAALALGGAFRTLARRDRPGLVLAAYPVVYWMVFGGFDRAFPRHALPLLPFAAVFTAAFAAWLWSRPRRGAGVAAAALAAACLAGPATASWRLATRLSEPTPADLAAAWAAANLGPESRVLQDQYTPRLDAHRTHRLRVEEKYFLGSYDWVMRSGYPPGLETDGLRPVTTFRNDAALGDPIALYQAPERSTLMQARLVGDERELAIGAGELAYFGEGWHRPAPGAHGTSRLSRGERSEIYLELGAKPEDLPEALTLELVGEAVVSEPLELTLASEGGGSVAAVVPPESEEPSTVRLQLAGSSLTPGLNRFELRYGSRTRLGRRAPDTSLRLYEVRLRSVAGERPSGSAGATPSRSRSRLR